MRKWLWPGVLFATLVCSVFALLPQTSGLADFRSEFASRPSPTEGGGEKPLFKAVYLIVVDGLRFDVAQTPDMPFLHKMVGAGAAWGKVKVGLPSYSRPGYERILSGAPSELTGLTMNDQSDPSPVPTIFSLAADSGLRTAASAHYWVRELVDGPLSGDRTGLYFGAHIQRGYSYLHDEPDSRVFAVARDIVRTHDPHLLLILPGTVDETGHAHGGKSVSYRENATAVDEALADFFHSLPDHDCLVLVTSDHGHRNAGGHGGGEREVLEVPLFAWGPGVRPGRMQQAIDQMDIAPTVAAALGLPMAGTMGGRVLVEAFTDPIPWEAREERLKRVQRTYLADNADLLGKRATAPNAGFARVWEESRKTSLLRRLYWRLPAAVFLLAGIALAGIGMVRELRWRWPMLAGAAYPLYFYALLRLVGYDYTYSAIVSSVDFSLKASLAALLSLVILTWAGAALRRGSEPYFRSTSLGLWAVQSILTAVAWLMVGGTPHRFLPDLGWQVFLMVQLLVTAIVAVYALAGWLVLTVFHRRRTAGVKSVTP